MKLKNTLLCITIIICSPLQIISAKDAIINSNLYILYNRNDESIIVSENEQYEIAPTIFTQWLSALLIIENTRHYDKEFSIGFNDYGTAFTSDLTVGEYITVQDALFGMLLGHDGSIANACGRHMAGSEQEFIRLLNQKAKSIGMQNTNFTNITGDSDFYQYTTLQDLAILIDYAFKNDTFKKIITMEEYTFTTNYGTHTFINQGYSLIKNENIYGTTEFQISNSLYGIVSAYEKDDKKYLFISLSNQQEDCINDTEVIYTQTSDSQQFLTPLRQDDKIASISLGFYLKRNIPVILQEDITILTDIETEFKDLEYEFISNSNPILILPNSTIGTVNIYQNDIVIKSIEIQSSRLYVSYELYGLFVAILFIICIIFYKGYSKNLNRRSDNIK